VYAENFFFFATVKYGLRDFVSLVYPENMSLIMQLIPNPLLLLEDVPGRPHGLETFLECASLNTHLC